MKSELKNFKSTASLPEQGLVLMFDLEGFSKFFAQPDVQEYVPKYLNHVINAVKICIEGGTQYWTNEKIKWDTLPASIHWKFLGDGILVIWKYKDFKNTEIVNLFNALWTLKKNFKKVNINASEDVPVVDIPQKIRFGLASGTIYKLNYQNTRSEEFIGYSINLASRLQSYCRDLGFIASARINIPKNFLNKHKYMKIIAKNIKGFPREIVIVDKNEYNALLPEVKKELFEEIK